MNKLNSLTNNKAIFQTTVNTSEQQSLQQTAHIKNTELQMKVLCLLVSRLFNNRIYWAFQTTRLLPLRHLRIQQRLKKVIEGVFRRQDYQKKWEAFQNIRRVQLNSEKRDYLHAKEVLKKQRGTAIRLFTAFVIGKKRSILNKVLGQLKDIGQMKQHELNNNYRRGARTLIKIFKRKVGDCLSCIKDSRVIINQTKRMRLMFKIIKQIRTQNMRWAFVEIRREMLRNRREKALEEIKELDEKLGGEEDEEMKGLQDKHKELSQQLQGIKKEREDIQANFQGQIKQAENKNKEMKENLQSLKAKQEEMKNKIVQIDQQLKTPFSFQEIYQLCYENLLWTLSQTSQKTYNKQQLLKSLQTPMVPIDMPIEQLKQENQVLKDLLSEYVLMYGQKKLPQGGKLEIPYENLLKQNNLLYKMLMTLLPNAQFIKEELLRVRQIYEGVDTMVKQYASK